MRLHVVARDIVRRWHRGGSLYRFRCSCGLVGVWRVGRGGKHDASREGLEHMVEAGQEQRR